MDYLADQLLFRTITKRSLQTTGIFFFVIFVVINHNMQNFMVKNWNKKIAANTALNEFVDIQHAYVFIAILKTISIQTYTFHSNVNTCTPFLTNFLLE